MTTPKRKTEISRSEIIHAVWQVMYTRGVGAVSFRSVATEAGVSAGRVQYHFPTKEALIHGSFQDLILRAAQRHAQLTEDSTVEAELRNILAQPLAESPAARRGVAVYYSYLALAVTDPEISRILTESRRGARREIQELLTRLGANPAAALQLQALSEGLTLGVFQGDISADQAHRTLSAALREAGAQRPPLPLS
ncbi:TetR/AcrR family transcriptional regulator [Corynebacterium pacaense]|uniref:TetR/AcrR family transcriptional regulator n=1 Tax=Corynebacterium pacaense TaxID=1816684 RepID=UPI0009BAC8D4|nr:TetR/AcrR family transcriptional regulator [Corynebacterium pacaense]